MTTALILLFVVLLVVLAFEYINGFHDTANAIATVVSTKVLTPRQALLLASGMNLVGAFFGQAVAKTIHSGIVDDKIVAVTTLTVFCAMMGGIIWNLVTWWFGMPSSSTHALVGGLIGASLGAAKGNWHVLIWSRVKIDKVTGAESMEGIFHKVVVPMITSPLLGLTVGFLLMGFIFALLCHKWPYLTAGLGGLVGALAGWHVPVLLLHLWHMLTGSQYHLPEWLLTLTAIAGYVAVTIQCWRMGGWHCHKVNTVFSKLQVFSAAYMGFGHGMADAQKTMGVIMLTLFAATQAGELNGLPEWMGFLKIADKSATIPTWIIMTCAITMAAGTYAGGWRIIKTLGHKMVKMKPVHGFAAETTAATILAVTGYMGMPVSTTHTITTSIMGVGAAKRWNAIQWSLVERIVWAWIMTIPVTALLSYGIYKLCAIWAA